jgi:Photosynthesis system II assembly factor YCF48
MRKPKTTLRLTASALLLILILSVSNLSVSGQKSDIKIFDNSLISTEIIRAIYIQENNEQQIIFGTDQGSLIVAKINENNEIIMPQLKKLEGLIKTINTDSNDNNKVYVMTTDSINSYDEANKRWKEELDVDKLSDQGNVPTLGDVSILENSRMCVVGVYIKKNTQSDIEKALLFCKDKKQDWKPAKIPNNQVQLTNLTFSENNLEGWAVGTKGAIWTTKDAGKEWKEQRTRIESHLLSVFDYGSKVWAVGYDSAVYSYEKTKAITPVVIKPRTQSNNSRLVKGDVIILSDKVLQTIFNADVLPLIDEISPINFGSQNKLENLFRVEATVVKVDKNDKITLNNARIPDNVKPWVKTAIDNYLSNNVVDKSDIEKDTQPIANTSQNPKSPVPIQTVSNWEPVTIPYLTKPGKNKITLRSVKFSTQSGWIVGDNHTILYTIFNPKEMTQLQDVDFYSIFIDDEYCWVGGSKGKLVRIKLPSN